jgi:hypothetical protein
VWIQYLERAQTKIPVATISLMIAKIIKRRGGFIAAYAGARFVSPRLQRDRVGIETPFITDAKGGDLLRAQEAIKRDRMDPQILRDFLHC